MQTKYICVYLLKRLPRLGRVANKPCCTTNYLKQNISVYFKNTLAYIHTINNVRLPELLMQQLYIGLDSRCLPNVCNHLR
jgi:hypothetical protein